MNTKQRAEKIKEMTNPGDKIISSQYGEKFVTRVSKFNCYLKGVNEIENRSTWNTIEWCFRNKQLSFKDEAKQAKVLELYIGARTEKKPI